MRSESRRTVSDLLRIRSAGLLRRFSNAVRIARKDAIDAQERHRAAHAAASPRERQEELLAFYTQYEDFVELLCDAAQYGSTPRLEGRYAEIRSLLLARYDTLKPLLGAFLRPSMDDTRTGECDAFEDLLMPATVSDFLHSDDGDTIGRITRTREALNLYGEHLRQLAGRTG
jgi:hypothetical protein